MIWRSTAARIGLKLFWMGFLVFVLIMMASTKMDFIYRAF